ncbi:MAG: ABC transporter ATP-binding protein [Anaerolineales bacterium]
MRRRPVFVEKQKPEEATRVLRRLAPYFAPYKGYFILMAFALVLGTLADLAAPYFIGVAVDQFINPGGEAAPAWLQLLVPEDATRVEGLTRVMLLLGSTYILVWGLNVIQFRLMVIIAQKALLVMRSQIMGQIQRLSLGFFDEQDAGDLMSRLSNDTEVINDTFGPGVTRALRMMLSLSGIAISMVLLNWRLALASFSLLPIVALVIAYFSSKVRTAFRQTRQTIGEVSTELEENISGVREVQAFAREGQTFDEFEAINERNRSANVKAQTLSALFVPMLNVLSTVAMAIVIGVGGYMILNYSPPLVSIGVIVTFLNYVRRFYDPIRELGNLWAQIQAALAGAERIFELLDVEPAITDPPDPIPLPKLEGHVTYDHVSFRYEEDEPVLQDVSIEIEPGHMTAIVGPTGAGKTTLINLLMRFYDPDEGAVRVDGIDIRNVKRESLRQQIGVVPQDTFLFSDTIMHNIRYGRLDATDEEVKEAARIANAHTFIEQAAEGYETVLGERGTGVSHGNRQMLAIARAVLKDPRILILDEATSAMDSRTEQLIQDALEKLMAQRTSLVIAHRLSTVRSADEILVLEQGRIVERGTHTELLERQGVYHDLYMSQFRREEKIAPAAREA